MTTRLEDYNGELCLTCSGEGKAPTLIPFWTGNGWVLRKVVDICPDCGGRGTR